MSLIQIGRSGKDRLALEHLTKDAADSPHVYGSGVATQLQQKLGRSVPSSDHQSSIVSLCFTATLASLRSWVVVWPGQPKISDLEYAVVVDQEIRGFHIPMQDLAGMQVSKALE